MGDEMNAVANANLPRRHIPGWFIAVAVLLTMGITVFVMMKRNPNRWPASAVEMPTLVAQSASPMMAGAQQYPMRTVAANQPIPRIRAGSTSKHEDRGACALCHEVVDVVGNTIPAIHAYSALPHPYKGGLCINCHRTIPAPANNLLPMAATQGAPNVAQPTEAAWMGMEVGPITPLLAEQYQIPAGVRGVIVAEAEGQAGLSGVQAGDVVVAVNGQLVPDMATFANITQNGALAAGSMIALRDGKQMEFAFDRKLNGQPVQPAAPAAQQYPTYPQYAQPQYPQPVYQQSPTQNYQQALGAGPGPGAGHGYGAGQGYGPGCNPYQAAAGACPTNRF